MTDNNACDVTKEVLNHLKKKPAIEKRLVNGLIAIGIIVALGYAASLCFSALQCAWKTPQIQVEEDLSSVAL